MSEYIFWHIITGIVMLPAQTLLYTQDKRHIANTLKQPVSWIVCGIAGYFTVFGLLNAINEVFRKKAMYCEPCGHKMSDYQYKFIGCPCCNTTDHTVPYNKIKHLLKMNKEDFVESLQVLRKPIEDQAKLSNMNCNSVTEKYLSDFFYPNKKNGIHENISPEEIIDLAWICQNDIYVGVRTRARQVHHKIEKQIMKIAYETGHISGTERQTV